MSHLTAAQKVFAHNAKNVSDIMNKLSQEDKYNYLPTVVIKEFGLERDYSLNVKDALFIAAMNIWAIMQEIKTIQSYEPNT